MWRNLIAAIILAGSLMESGVWAATPAAQPAPAVPDAQATFNEIKALIEDNYVDEVSQDALWTGAIQGMMGSLLQMEGHPTNQLMTPAELEQLKVGISGEISGIGVMIQDVSGILVITDLIDGGGAAAAGLLADDRILAIDGERIKGMSLAEVAGRIRGPVDTTVSLLVQRDTEEWEVEVSRSRVAVPHVWSDLLDGGVGIVGIDSFTDRTAEEVSQQVEALMDRGAHQLVLDLRRCPGGLLDSAVEVAGMFLPKGATIMSIDWSGEADRDVRAVKRKGAFADLPLVVLIDRNSASGAEIVAAALADNDRALLLGETSFGKGTVEKIFDLESGWAVKLSVAYFYAPDGTSWRGKGLTPDLPITGASEGQAVTPQDDPVVQAARSVLRMRR